MHIYAWLIHIHPTYISSNIHERQISRNIHVNINPRLSFTQDFFPVFRQAATHINNVMIEVARLIETASMDFPAVPHGLTDVFKENFKRQKILCMGIIKL